MIYEGETFRALTDEAVLVEYRLRERGSATPLYLVVSNPLRSTGEGICDAYMASRRVLSLRVTDRLQGGEWFLV